MDNNNDKRSPTIRMKATDTRSPGVGGRQADTHPLSGGGGYQDICIESVFSKKILKKSEDPRINELREIGLGHKWLQMAEAIGFDNFMTVWSILDEENINNGGVTCERIRMWVPAFKRYLRYQRNRYIIARASDNDARPEKIQKEINKLLGEQLSLAHIKRIMDKVNISE